ncbi:DUF6750 family protein [Cupriavidus sp. TMH.W2]|uniref:DUF6750 family protein n=1 Tax=Cupriavidus sp. TMH.W2 TaxID=3434465 RepID=UPI003D776B98
MKEKSSQLGGAWSRWKGVVARATVALVTVNASKAAYAAGGLVGMLTNLDNLFKAAITTITYGSLAAGAASIVYGMKLIRDRSSDRENVKLAHIAYALVGGTGLLALWFVITMLVETTGGSSSDIGRQQSF